MASLRNHLPSFVMASWIIGSIVVAIAYALCRGTAEAAMPHEPDATLRP